MTIVITTPATVFPVTLAEAKDHCRVDGTAEDTKIDAYIAAATGHVESYCGRSFTEQGLTLYQDAFAPEMLLLRGPVGAVSAVTYYDADNVLQTLDGAVYDTDLYSNPATVSLATGQSWPTTYARKNAVQIAYTTSVARVPDAVNLAIKLLVQQWLDHPSAAGEKNTYSIPNGIDALLANHRSFAF